MEDEELREIIVGELGGCNCNVDDVAAAISPLIRAREAKAAEAMRDRALSYLSSDPVRTGDADDYADGIRALPNPYGQPA